MLSNYYSSIYHENKNSISYKSEEDIALVDFRGNPMILKSEMKKKWGNEYDFSLFFEPKFEEYKFSDLYSSNNNKGIIRFAVDDLNKICITESGELFMSIGALKFNE